MGGWLVGGTGSAGTRAAARAARAAIFSACSIPVSLPQSTCCRISSGRPMAIKCSRAMKRRSFTASASSRAVSAASLAAGSVSGAANSGSATIRGKLSLCSSMVSVFILAVSFHVFSGKSLIPVRCSPPFGPGAPSGGSCRPGCPWAQSPSDFAGSGPAPARSPAAAGTA